MSVYQKPLKAVEIDFCGRTLKLEYGRFANQASGAVVASLGDTSVLCVVGVSKQAREGTDFFPMMVDYEEKFYAAGKMSGSRFIKREGRPSEQAVLNSRLIDRSLRPMFAKGTRNDIQVICTVLSADLEVSPAALALTGASAAMLVAGIPIEDAVSGVRIGMADGQFVVNPTYEQVENGALDLMVAGTDDAIMMVEARANELSEDKMLEALEFAHKYIKEACQLQKALLDQVKPEPMELVVEEADDTLLNRIKGMVTDSDLDAVKGQTKKEHKAAMHVLEDKIMPQFAAEIEDGTVSAGEVAMVLEKLVEKQMRKNILASGTRLDGRTPDQVRPVFAEVGLLARTHGSGMFQRGETQVLNVCTLAGPGAAQLVDTMDEDKQRTYMHHYNFPGYCVGEVKPMRSPGRREIGHGYLAERALIPVLPDKADFPYTIRTVSEVMACNGSSSMGSVCGSTLSLMDAGVPIKAPVSGIAMGLISDADTGQYKILSDIQGLEDFGGDMDLKVAGTRNGITALQMDIKLKGLQMSLLKEAIMQAGRGREEILVGMLKAIERPRAELSKYAPVIETIQIDPDKIREVIGKGGETIQGITGQTETEIDIEQDGLVSITAPNREKADQAIAMIKAIVTDPEPGTDYEGKVVKVMDFGAFVEFLPGKDGLVHISKFSKKRIDNINDVVKLGDKLKVRLEEIDSQGRYNLTHLPFAQDAN